MTLGAPCFEWTAAHSTIIWSARLGSPSSRSRKRLCRRTATSIHSFLIFQKTLHCTRKQRSRLLSLFSRQINHRMYQIYKDDGVVNRFLTARRHFWTSWSERTHYMENGQSVFFSLASPALRIRACEAHGLALTLLLPYSKPILGKKIRLFCSLKHCSKKFTDHLNAIWYRYKLQPHSQGSLLRRAGRREPWERGCTSYRSDKRVLYSNNQFMNGILTWFDSNSSFRNLRIILSDLRFHNAAQDKINELLPFYQ